MSDTKFTKDQLEAINNRGGTLLVSAAAGSGKTAVLVERIIKKILVDKVPINKFLIVTFTNKAASEMAEKIEHKMLECIAIDPKNTFLREQLSLIHKAQITTVHSFCFNLIREYFSFLNLSPDFKIASDMDILILKKDCMRKILDEKFKETSENLEFNTLIDIIGERNIDSEMLKIYNFLQSHANPLKFLKENEEQYRISNEKGFKYTFWHKVICEKNKEILQDAKNHLEKALDFAKMCDELYEKNYQLIFDEYSAVLSILEDFYINNEDFGDIDGTIERISSLEFPRWKNVKNTTNEDAVEKAKAHRDFSKTLLREKLVISQNYEKISQDSSKLFDVMTEINDIIFKFTNLFTKSKREKNILDFNDAEHLALSLVCESTRDKFQKSDLGYEISDKFTEILVDEYQDTNEIQDILFKMISNDEKNIFMVGDVKQSIYKFRLADPSIFLEKYEKFKGFESALNDEPRKVVLKQNFRSRSEILESTNFIFENVMTKETCGVLYDSDQKLHLGANYSEKDNVNAEFILVDYDKISEKIDKNPNEIEAEAIISEINKLISEDFKVFDKNLGYDRKITLNDIVILLRSQSNKAYFYKNELEKAGFSVDFKEGTEKIFGTPEIKSLISIFRLLNNFLSDLDLINVLRSPIFAFNDDHIASIRNADTSLYQNILDASENGDEKCREFLSDLEEFFEFSSDNTIFETLWFIIDKKNILPIYSLMEYGSKRYSNILRFLDFVEGLDDSFSVFDFVTFLDRIDSKSAKLPSSVSSSDNIKIMSIHASKGLEFPVVFLADMNKEFNKLDLKSVMTMHNKLGLGMRCNDDENIVSYPSIMQKAIKSYVEKELLAEEIRILYVAMTRPKEKLFVMCTAKKPENLIKKWLEVPDFSKANSYSYLFGPNILKLPSSKVFYETFDILENINIDPNLKNYFICKYIDNLEETSDERVNLGDSDIKEFKEFSYKFLNETKIPSKLTATSVRDDKISLDSAKSIKVSKRLPSFLSESKITGAMIGTAHHKVMQFIDFSNCKDVQSTKDEVLRLYENDFITKAECECINPYKILSFVQSDIYERMQKSLGVRREFKFSILANADKYYDLVLKDDVLLQGVVDCLFFEQDGIVMIDYKTDSVNLENIQDIKAIYAKQLKVYENALEEIYGLPVKEKLLYFFSNESFVSV